MEKRKVTFVCSGNTCRSPMAAALFDDSIGPEIKEKITINSVGILTRGGESAAKNAITSLQKRGIDISKHTSKLLDVIDITTTDLFVCMTKEQVWALVMQGADHNKIINLNISDPYGGNEQRYEECVQEIISKLPEVRKALKI